MKNLIFLIIVFFNTFLVKSQSDKILITYELGNNKKNDKIVSKDKRVKLMMNQINSVRKDIEFELVFDREKSFFYQKKKLIPNDKELIYKLASHGVTSDVIYFKNKNQKFKIKDFLGEIFKINYPHNQFDWKVTDETKEILGYKCFKAITTWEEYDYGREVTLKFESYAYFTYDLPYGYGPKGMDGLPGVVLEGSLNGVTYFKAARVTKDKNFNFPKIPKAKEISFTDYLKLIGNDMKEKIKM